MGGGYCGVGQLAVSPGETGGQTVSERHLSVRWALFFPGETPLDQRCPLAQYAEKFFARCPFWRKPESALPRGAERRSWAAAEAVTLGRSKARERLPALGA